MCACVPNTGIQENTDFLCSCIWCLIVLQLRIINKHHLEMFGPWTASSCVLEDLTVSSKEADEMLQPSWSYPQVSPLNNITLKNIWFISYSIVWFNVFHLHLHRNGSIIWDRDCYNINIPAYEMGKGRDLINEWSIIGQVWGVGIIIIFCCVFSV